MKSIDSKGCDSRHNHDSKYKPGYRSTKAQSFRCLRNHRVRRGVDFDQGIHPDGRQRKEIEKAVEDIHKHLMEQDAKIDLLLSGVKKQKTT